VPSSPNLSWTPCYWNFTCANLIVPLDYDNPSIGNITVAFLKKAAKHQPAKGDVLINPGGPGGSGVDFVINYDEVLESLLGGTYNLIGFDPRGVNNSGPNLDCFAGKPATRDYYDQNYYTYDPTSALSMAEHFQAAGAFGDWCSKTVGYQANYANTPATARDMLQYVEKLAESQGKAPEKATLNYYGISYGSVLGTTFATLFPDRVGRMIIDGVVDVEDYYHGSWTANLRQADDAVRSFFQFCFDAGSECAFFRNDSSPGAIGKRFDALLEHIEKHPIPVSDPAIVDFPTVITAFDVRGALLIFIYDSISTFPLLALVLSELEGGSMANMILLRLSSRASPMAAIPRRAHFTSYFLRFCESLSLLTHFIMAYIYCS
ncbi:hypothetical protein K505DRAFT_244588, partial [Melanomma pulvis-pyrius CBS 109.77]